MKEGIIIIAKKSASKKEIYVSRIQKRNFSQSDDSRINHIFHLQRTAGNQSVQRLLTDKTTQPKLTIGKPGDKYEKEADRIAYQVMRMSQWQAQKRPEDNEKNTIQQKFFTKQITPLIQNLTENEEENCTINDSDIVVLRNDLKKAKTFMNLKWHAIQENWRNLPQTGCNSVEGHIKQFKGRQNQMAKMLHAYDQRGGPNDSMIHECRRWLEKDANSLIQRQKENEDENEEKSVQAKAKGKRNSIIPNQWESGIHSLKGSGQPLSSSERAFFEPRFGRDFSSVRIHNDSNSADTAKSLNATAFTIGRNIVFGASQYAPDTTSGRRLIAHELTHVVQQTNIPGTQVQLKRRRRRPKARSKYINRINVKLSAQKDVSSIVWLFAKNILRKKFPKLNKKQDFRYSVGRATALFTDRTKENFDVSGGAIKGYRTPKGFFRIHRKEGIKYISSRGDPMPYASYFYKGYAFHGCGGIASMFCLDYPSHGCIHVMNTIMSKLHPFIKLKRTKVMIK